MTKVAQAARHRDDRSHPMHGRHRAPPPPPRAPRRTAGAWRARLLAVGVLVSALLVHAGVLTSVDDKSPFLTTRGTTFVLRGQPLRLTGLNVYGANSLGTCGGDLGSGPELGRLLAAVHTRTGGGAKVIRAWFFQSLSHQPGAAEWAAFDHTLAVAKAHGFLVVATLGNQWADCDGAWPSRAAGYKTESWYRTGYRTTAGSAPGLPLSYRDYVARVVARYRDNPTIAMWQLMNEAEANTQYGGPCSPTAAASLRGFAQDMSSLVKRIDPNHLLSVGTIGAGECGANGSDYRTLHALPSVDVCEYHDYSPDALLPGGDGTNGLRRRIEQCDALHKPLLVGELGANAADVGGVQQRASVFDRKLSAELSAGVAGVLLWNLDPGGSSHDSYDIGPADPALRVLGRHS